MEGSYGVNNFDQDIKIYKTTTGWLYQITYDDGETECVEFMDETSKVDIKHILSSHRDRRNRLILQSRLDALMQTVDKQEKTSSEDPPRFAEAAFAWFAPKGTVDAQLGDLQELFAKNLQNHGYRRARWLYWLQVMRAVAPALFRLLKRIGFIGLIIDYCRTKLGL
jgi:hypothetical protein